MAQRKPIRPLPPTLISQIAAGEVVERPASVVKELIENALDAQAKRIEVRIRDAGRTLIEVRDDGYGIPADELALAVSRHTTSKVGKPEDLFRIHTLGFRGEALAAIASVSHLTLISRPPEASTGAVIRVEGGRILGPVRPVAAPQGTTVRVEHLFFNVPARRKFLKTPATERRAIDETVLRYALAYPQVRFRLEHDGRLVLHTDGSGQVENVLVAIHGPRVVQRMFPVLYEDEPLRVHGWIGAPDLNRSHSRDMLFFVNGRPVQDPALVRAVLQGYHTFLMKGRYPLVVLFLELPPETVDVNVHPTKAEVRFRHPDRVFRAVQHAVRKALLAHSPLTPTPITEWDLLDASGRPRSLPWEEQPPSQEASPTEAGVSPEASQETESEPPSPSSLAFARAGDETSSPPLVESPLLRLIGQVAATYLVAEGPDGLYLIDQHAAHERVLFEQLMAQRRTGQVSRQPLLQPVVVRLPPPQARVLEGYLETLERWGFEVEPFGPNTFQVRALPAVLAHGDAAAALRVLVEDFEENEEPLARDREARLIARICKRLAVKGGQTLPREAQERLLQDLLRCENPRTCPHGRPTMIHIPVDLLERKFGRRG